MPRRETVAAAVQTPPRERTEAPPVKLATITHEVRTVLVEAPMGKPGTGYLSRHVEARLDVPQAESLKGLLAGLRDARAELANGREVLTAAEAVKWLLEKLSDSDS